MYLSSALRLFVCLVLLVSLVSAQDAVEGRSKRRKAILPLLMGVVLKMSTLVPMSLMLFAFLTISALFAAKLALGLVGAVGLHILYKKSEEQGSGLTELAANIPQSPYPSRRYHIKQ